MAAVEDQAVTTGIEGRSTPPGARPASPVDALHADGGYDHDEVPIIVRGEGCHVYDEHGNRYLDGLAALFCVNIGHGRADVAQAGADQAKELGFYTTGARHPAAIESPRASPTSRRAT